MAYIRSFVLAWLALGILFLGGCKRSYDSGAVNEQVMRLEPERFRLLELEPYWKNDLALAKGETLVKIWLGPKSLYCLTSENIVHRLEREKGITTWARQPAEAGCIVREPVEVSDKTLIIAHNVAKVYDLRTGTLLERFDLEFGVGSDPAFDGEVAYVPDTIDSVRAIALTTHRELWTCRARDLVTSRPAVKDGLLVSVSQSGEVLGYDTQTHQKLWPKHFQTRDVILARPILTDKGFCYIAGTDTLLYCLSSATGMERWRYFSGRILNEAPTVVNDERVYLTVPGKGLICLDAATGAEMKNFQFPEAKQYLGQVDDRLYILEDWRRIVAVQASSGKRLDEVKLMEFDFFVTNTESDKLYIATDGGRIVCLQKLGLGQLQLEDIKPSGTSE